MKRRVLLLTVLLFVAFGCQSNNDKASSEPTREEATNGQHQEQATTSSQEGSSQEGSDVHSSEASYYAVVEGDSLWQISRNYLGPDAPEEDVLYFTEDLCQLNAGTIGDDPNLIFPDQVLIVPSGSIPPKDSFSEPEEASYDAGQYEQYQAVPDSLSPQEGYYNVAEGDSLWTIARMHLGANASEKDVLYFTQDIYQANAGTIGDDPSLVFPDQVLYIETPTSPSNAAT